MKSEIQRNPDRIFIHTEEKSETLSPSGPNRWAGTSGEILLDPRPSGFAVSVLSLMSLKRMMLRWDSEFSGKHLILGDSWERGYGDLEWRGMVPERILPWYFLAHDGSRTDGFGVMVRPSAMCFWQVDPAGISLWLDMRCGGSAVSLGDRILDVATVVFRRGTEGESAFEAARAFCRVMCSDPVLPSGPVFGGNNWYYAYGKSSAARIIEDTKNIVELCPSGSGRPFMIIDSCWQERIEMSCCVGGPWKRGNQDFPDMPSLASRMKALGAKPGLWCRPLLTLEEMPEDWYLQRPKAQVPEGVVLDPSVPGVLEKVTADVAGFSGWGYELIKNDFTTWDIFGRWGFEMGANLTDSGWSFRDTSRTTAEIIKDLYAAVAAGAGKSLVIGCNTIGHLSAGVFAVSRTGDDTSGREWERTRKMGVNTLAFRMSQHGTFHAADADCLGVTGMIPWELNREWCSLLAGSGTPFFVSAEPKTLGTEQKKDLRVAFGIASARTAPAEPLDWMATSCPSEWRMAGQKKKFEWFEKKGVDFFFNDSKE